MVKNHPVFLETGLSYEPSIFGKFIGRKTRLPLNGHVNELMNWFLSTEGGGS
jgi:hypothetical protein